jgi:hypothetical protein
MPDANDNALSGLVWVRARVHRAMRGIIRRCVVVCVHRAMPGLGVIGRCPMLMITPRWGYIWRINPPQRGVIVCSVSHRALPYDSDDALSGRTKQPQRGVIVSIGHRPMNSFMGE